MPLPRSRASRAALGVAAALLATAALTGCSSTVSLPPAASANDPLCAEVTVRLPQTLADQDRRWTDAQATGAWGAAPAPIVLACGVTPPGPTEDKCITIGGVDWIVDESQAPRYRVTSYGREPAVQVVIDNEVVSSNDVLAALGPIVSALPLTAECVSTETLLP